MVAYVEPLETLQKSRFWWVKVGLGLRTLGLPGFGGCMVWGLQNPTLNPYHPLSLSFGVPKVVGFI